MNRSRVWIIIVVALLLVNTAVLAMLWFKRPPEGPPPGGAKDFIVKELGLTADQQKKFDELRKDHQDDIKRIMEGMRELKDELAEKITASQVDSAALNTLTSRISEKERPRDPSTFYHFRSIRAILNATQQQKFDKILKQVLRMMVPGGQRPPQGPPGREGAGRPPGDSGEMPPPPGENGPQR
jgi:Spy/CpxP family protein refolding chaperone